MVKVYSACALRSGMKNLFAQVGLSVIGDAGRNLDHFLRYFWNLDG